MDQESVDGFFSLSLEGFLRHLKNVQIFCLATRKTARLRAGGRETSLPATKWYKKHKLFSRMDLTWL